MSFDKEMEFAERLLAFVAKQNTTLEAENERLKEVLKRVKKMKSDLERALTALEFYAGEGERKVTVNGKEHWVREYGCACCAHSYDVDDDGSIGVMNCELDDVRGMYAREVLAEIRK